ncbi:hypothetical protein K439DRAFT_517694 [Ramaria rubella]|nr:hypothetical protein K439DRAFT_517694 [Ramaria rubella]
MCEGRLREEPVEVDRAALAASCRIESRRVEIRAVRGVLDARTNLTVTTPTPKTEGGGRTNFCEFSWRSEAWRGAAPAVRLGSRCLRYGFWRFWKYNCAGEGRKEGRKLVPRDGDGGRCGCGCDCTQARARPRWLRTSASAIAKIKSQNQHQNQRR